MVLDISPTLTMYDQGGQNFCTLYYHWYFLVQPYPIPETLIGNNSMYFLEVCLGNWGKTNTSFIDTEVMNDYKRCFTPDSIHSICEDYRASSTIDLGHDRGDSDNKIICPLHVIWGKNSVVGKIFNPLEDWKIKCVGGLTGNTLDCGHFIPEEKPDELVVEMLKFFKE